MKRDDFDPLSAIDRGVLRFLTCGSVDDGKSTLIGRLLYDTKTLLSDTLATLERHAHKRGLSALDLSLLTDGLVADREQGITIDVAYRYFATARRKFIIADSPGHEQYTRNMVTAASTADVAVLLIDARRGVLAQTKRHATIAALLGIKQLILAVNKMDLVGWSQDRFDAIVADFRQWLAGHPELAGADIARRLVAVPLSALVGDMVVERGENLDWYRGATLVELLEDAPTDAAPIDAPLRLPVLWVCRPSQSDWRGYAGRIESGRVSLGDEITVLPSGLRSRVTAIAIGATALTTARAGQSVMLTLADERDISPGDTLVLANDATTPRAEFSATVCWLNAAPLAPQRSYLLRHGTQVTRARIATVERHLDIHTLAWQPALGAIALNDIASLRLKTQQPIVADVYAEARSGSFILIDETSNETVAAGVITQ